MKKDEVLRVIEEAARNKQVVLYLPDNQLTSLPAEIAKLTDLTELNLSGNQLTSLPAEIAKLTDLTGLYLSKNQLESLPAEIGELTNLTGLYLSKNQLKTLPAEIVKLKNLTTLDLSGNPLESPPIEIARQGTIAIRSYFESLEAKKNKKIKKEKATFSYSSMSPSSTRGFTPADLRFESSLGLLTSNSFIVSITVSGSSM